MYEDAGLRKNKMDNNESAKNIKQRESENMNNKQFAIRVTYLLTAADMSCLCIQLATIPYLSKHLGLDSVGFGVLQTIYGVLQLVGGPIFGRFSDKFGVRSALTLSFLSGSVFHLLVGISTNIPLLFFSRLPGLFMHGIPGAQMVITDCTTPSERAGALGKIGLFIGLGMIIGSSLGGFLAAKFGLYVPPFVALAGSLVSTLVVLKYIPRQTKTERLETKASTSESRSVFNIKETMRLMSLPGVMPVFLIKVCSGFPVGLFTVMFSVICINFFGLDPEQSGYLMSYFGILQMVIQGLVIGKLTKWFSDGTLLLVCLVTASAVGLAMALMSNVFHFCLIAPPLMFSMCLMHVIGDSILTKSVPSSDTGAMLGICASVHPLNHTLGPAIGGIMYERYGVSSFGWLHCAVNIVLIFYLFKKKIHLKGQKFE